jgi:hypothetical protein
MAWCSAFILVLLAFFGASPAKADSVPPELAAGAATLESASSYHVAIRTSGVDPAKGLILADFEQPDRLYAHFGTMYDIIRIGPNVWMKEPSQPWKQLSDHGAGAIAAIAPIPFPATARSGPPTLGRDAVGPAHVYVVASEGTDPPLQWYVRIADGQIHRIVGPGKLKNSVLIIDIENYGEKVTIEPPAP